MHLYEYVSEIWLEIIRWCVFFCVCLSIDQFKPLDTNEPIDLGFCGCGKAVFVLLNKLTKQCCSKCSIQFSCSETCLQLYSCYHVCKGPSTTELLMLGIKIRYY